jgi:hypothetical protein
MQLFVFFLSMTKTVHHHFTVDLKAIKKSFQLVASVKEARSVVWLPHFKASEQAS